MRHGAAAQFPVIFLTVLLDIVGFSLVFPLFPAMLGHYLATEEAGGVFSGLIHALQEATGSAGDASSSFRLSLLFGGALGSIYSALQFVFAPVWGSLSDRMGRRPVLIVTTAGMAASYLIWVFSGSFAVFVLSRILGGVMSGNLSVATAAAADLTHARHRAGGMAIVGIAFGLGFLVGPALGGILSTVKLPFAATGEGTHALLAVHPFSLVAAGACLLSTCNCVWVAARFKESWERGTTPPSPHRTAWVGRLFRRQGIPEIDLANLIWFIYILVFSGLEFTLTFLAVDRFGYTPRQNAYLFVFAGLVMIFVQGALVRSLAPVHGEKALGVAGLILLIPGFVITGVAARQGQLYLGLGLVAVGSALVSPAMSALVSLYTSPDRQGSVLGVFRSLGALARALGPLSACVVYWRFGGVIPYIVGAAVLLAPLAMAMRLPRPPHHPEVSSSPDFEA